MVEKLNANMIDSIKTGAYIKSFLSVKKRLFIPDIWEVEDGIWKSIR